MSTVCILTSNMTAYDSIPGILGLVGNEFTKLGHRVIEVDLTAGDFVERLAEVARCRDDAFAIAMSGIGLEIRSKDNRLFWDAARLPCFAWYCDHPSYFIRRHRVESPHVVHGYVFPDHAKFNHDYIKANGAAFAVHMGIPDPRSFTPQSPGQHDKASRNGRILFAKSGGDPDALERNWRSILSRRYFNLLFDIIAASGRSCMRYPEIIREVAEQHGVYVTWGGKLFNCLMTGADHYIRATKATLVASVLSEYPVDFFGKGWDHMKTRATRATFHGPLPFAELRQRLPDYLASASINPNVDLSVHDRVFFAIGAGVVPIFDGNKFSAANMPMLDAYAFSYDRASIEAAVDTLLSRPEEAQASTAAALAALYPSFSMTSSARQIHEICTAVASTPEVVAAA
ncbi:MAG: hypothetical protein JO255_14710 [Alphaproteobacteria bacterium]|nr:hypothetical protein [Alphaproteobacteria bacterium]